MKRKMRFCLVSALACFALGVAALGAIKWKQPLTVKAEQATEESALPTVTLKGYNLSLQDNIYIMYAIDEENLLETDEFGMLIWRVPQETYEYGSQTAVLNSDSTVTTAGQTYSVFYYKELSAYEMTDVVYARAYVQREGNYYYSEVSRYSILDYIYNKLGKTLATPTEDEKLESLLESMLVYGAAAQNYAGYKTGSLPTDEFRYLTLENATFADGFAYGLYKAGTEETLSVADGDIPGGDWSDYISQNDNSDYVLNVPEERFSQGLAYTLSDDGTYYIVSGIGSCMDTELIIPYTYEGKKVQQIAASAFKSQTQLKSVNITANIVDIGASAFDGCTGVTELTIGRKVNGIGNSAFTGMTALTKINYNAVECADLSTGNYIFFNAGRSGLGIDVKIGANARVVPAALFCSTMKTSNTSTHYYVSHSPYIVNVEFESGSVCERIGSYAFGYCNTIETINTIPNGVKEIETGTFYNCNNLKNIIIPDTVTAIRSSAFYGCTSAEALTIGTGVQTIESNAFYDCTALTKINYNAVECADLSTGNYIFFNAGRSGLGIDVKIGANARVVPAALFCSTMKTSNTSTHYYVSHSPYIVNVEFESGSVCTRIGANAFSYCPTIETITYHGTIEAWNSMTMGSNWKLNSSALTTVICIDGTVAI